MPRPILPASYVNFQDGQIPKGPVPSGLFIFVGVAAGSATPGVVASVTTPNSLEALFGATPLARDLMAFFLGGGGFCYALPLAATTPGSIDAPSVGGFTGLAFTGTPKNAWAIVGKILLAGDADVAQYATSLDGGRTWGPAQVLKASGNKVVGAGLLDTGLVFSVTKTTGYALTDANFSVSTVEPTVTAEAIVDACDVAIQTASLQFNAFHFSFDPDNLAAATAFYSYIQAKLDDAAATWNKYLYAIVQAPYAASSTGVLGLAFAQGLRAGFAGKRVQVAGMPAVIKSQGGQHTMSISPLIAARRASLQPQNALALVRAGQLNAVVDFASGWKMSDVMAVDAGPQNVVTIRTHVGAAGFYFTFGRMSDPTSDYSFDSRRLVADLVATDCQSAGLAFLHMDVDPLDPVKSAEPLLAALRGPASQRVREGQASAIDFVIPEGQDILTSQELVVEVSILPMGHASWIKFNLGFKSPFAEV